MGDGGWGGRGFVALGSFLGDEGLWLDLKGIFSHVVVVRGGEQWMFHSSCATSGVKVGLIALTDMCHLCSDN